MLRILKRNSTAAALKGLTKSLKALKAAAAAADRRALAEERLIDKHVSLQAAAVAERNHALRVSDKLEDLLA